MDILEEDDQYEIFFWPCLPNKGSPVLVTTSYKRSGSGRNRVFSKSEYFLFFTEEEQISRKARLNCTLIKHRGIDVRGETMRFEALNMGWSRLVDLLHNELDVASGILSSVIQSDPKKVEEKKDFLRSLYLRGLGESTLPQIAEETDCTLLAAHIEVLSDWPTLEVVEES